MDLALESIDRVHLLDKMYDTKRTWATCRKTIKIDTTVQYKLYAFLLPMLTSNLLMIQPAAKTAIVEAKIVIGFLKPAVKG